MNARLNHRGESGTASGGDAGASLAMDASLDRQVWHMLTGRQAHLALGGGGAAKRIDPRYGPFAAMRDEGDEAQRELLGLVEGAEDQLWFVEPQEITPPPGLRVARRADLLQMVAGEHAGGEAEDAEAVLLDEDHAEAMTALALATKPGPWGPLTRCYGPFYGIFREERLVAMAGERMLPCEGLAEVSGVCTWPEFRGQGLARRLMLHVMAGFRARGDRPYLHTYADNAGAIALYRKLGFRERRLMILTVMVPA